MLSILKLVLNIDTNDLSNNPLNVVIANVLLFEAASLIISLYVAIAEDQKCREEMKKMTHEERLKIDKEIMKEYPDFWKDWWKFWYKK